MQALTRDWRLVFFRRLRLRLARDIVLAFQSLISILTESTQGEHHAKTASLNKSILFLSRSLCRVERMCV